MPASLRPGLLIALIVPTLVLASCKREATGQVMAVVNGEAITLSELNTELKRAAGGSLADKATLRKAALETLINRKLLAQQAKQRGLDNSPEYLMEQRAASENLLVAMLGQQMIQKLPTPTNTALTQFLARNPQFGAARAVYQLDQLTFGRPSDMAVMEKFRDDHSVDAVAARLTSLNMPFQRQRLTMDSVAAPPAFFAELVGLPEGEPLLTASSDRLIATAIVGRTAQPLSIEAARVLATEVLQRQAVERIAQDQLKQARGTAKISYQTGFENK